MAWKGHSWEGDQREPCCPGNEAGGELISRTESSPAGAGHSQERKNPKGIGGQNSQYGQHPVSTGN